MAEIYFDKQNVITLIRSGSTSKFIIPEYQRKYSWDEDNVNKMFDDFVEWSNDNLNKEKKKPYFFGSIVSYKAPDNQNEQEIIDGQQRITTLILLLRAIYTKLKKGNQSKEAINLSNEIEKLLWKANRESGEIDFNKPIISSEVISEEDNIVFNNILKTGEYDNKKKDLYTTNYKLILELLDEYANNSPTTFYSFVTSILDNVVIFPIESNDLDLAITIFETLNDRGKPLKDSDIFKAKFYKKLKTDEEKKEFVEKWKDLENKIEYDYNNNDEDDEMNELFNYEMYYLRAKDGDKDTTTPALRDYFGENNYERLNDSILDDIDDMINLWNVIFSIGSDKSITNEKWTKNNEILKVLDILWFYPNVWYKYPINIYYLKYHKEDNFEERFEKFLKRLCAELLRKYIETPGVNIIKYKVLDFNTRIFKSKNPGLIFDDKKYNYENFKNNFISPHKKIVSMILRFIAYSYQDNIIEFQKTQIEHILPRKFKNSYFVNVDDEEIKTHIEYIGNKILFERKLNIVAGDGYFGKKKEYYKQSKIKQTIELSKSKQEDFTLKDIEERNEELFNIFVERCEEWIR